MKRKTVRVHDKMQRDYAYELVVAPGRGFGEGFKPELSPAQMLRLGVFGGKYMTDCRREFPKSWCARAKLSPERRDPLLNFFGVDASQPMDVVADRLGARESFRADPDCPGAMLLL
jgi:hypothetical protein